MLDINNILNTNNTIIQELTHIDDNIPLLDINNILNISNIQQSNEYNQNQSLIELNQVIKNNTSDRECNNEELEDYIYTQQHNTTNIITNNSDTIMNDDEINITDIDYGQYLNDLISSETKSTFLTEPTSEKKVIRIGKKTKK